MSLYNPIPLFISRAIRNYPKNAHSLYPKRVSQLTRSFQTTSSNHVKTQDPDHTAANNAEKILYQGDESSESKIFAVGSSLATRLSTDRTLKCTEFDADGNIVAGTEEIKKSALVSKVTNPSPSCLTLTSSLQFGILSRDLRKIDDSHDFPAILVRPSTILVNFLQHRALITDKNVLVLHLSSKSGPSHNSAFMYGLQGKLNFGVTQHGALPYEFRALETILIMVISELDIEYQELKKPVNHVLAELEKDVDLEKLKKLLDVSKQVSFFRQKVKLVRSALHTVLEADDDMANMYLGEKAAGKPRAEAHHGQTYVFIIPLYDLCYNVELHHSTSACQVQFSQKELTFIYSSSIKC